MNHASYFGILINNYKTFKKLTQFLSFHLVLLPHITNNLFCIVFFSFSEINFVLKFKLVQNRIPSPNLELLQTESLGGSYFRKLHKSRLNEQYVLTDTRLCFSFDLVSQNPSNYIHVLFSL